MRSRFASLAFSTIGATLAIHQYPSATAALDARGAKPVSVYERGYGHLESDRNADLSAQVIAYRALEPDWDGQGGAVPGEETLEAALSFIDLLPLTANPTGAMLEATGEIGFYWHEAKAYIDITFDGADILYYAKVIDDDTGAPFSAQNRVRFDGNSLPPDLLTAISMV